MRIAGFWSRLGSKLIDIIFFIVSFGIYIIYLIYCFSKSKQSLGMRSLNIVYSSKNQFSLFLFKILSLFIYLTIVVIIIDIIRLSLKKGTLAELWSKNYLIIEIKKSNKKYIVDETEFDEYKY
ncbi:hypothetical protein SCORR_v1c06460 [Spiroplasma corruscae]|uniref:RDD domain-containing protein n=1 Tax=Spiroplasma corruscae TaxID=216934 RepID=A0A222EPG9_9MOLU|nr:hypothetical protein [Spiroplasma corruscae]ASP28418.1 hypothetical protein SCORR_v1c06460 [Spiroplasma corruscae]